MPGVVAVYETFENRSMKATTDRLREYTRTFVVETDLRTISPDVVLLTNGIPRRWDPYISAVGTVDLLSLCREVEPKQDPADPYTWRVFCRYSNVVKRPDIHSIDNPLLRPAEVMWDSVKVMRPVWRDVDGIAIWNSSAEWFDPPPEAPENRLVLRIVRNQLAYNAVFYLQYHDTVNNKPFYGFQKGRVKCDKIKGTRTYEAGFLYWKVEFEFTIRMANSEAPEADDGLDTGEPDSRKVNDLARAEKAWKLEILDRGFFEIVANEQVLLLDRLTGQPLTAPALLNGAGSRLPRTGTAEETAPKFRTYQIYPFMNFGKLQLGGG